MPINGWSSRVRPAFDNCRAMARTAFDLGINYFDVAPAYGGTRSETVLRKALRGIPRDRYWLMTKGAPDSAEACKRIRTFCEGLR